MRFDPRSTFFENFFNFIFIVDTTKDVPIFPHFAHLHLAPALPPPLPGEF